VATPKVQVAVERRPTLLLLVVLGSLFVLMSLSSRTRVLGQTRTLFERTVMTVFSPVPKVVNWVGENAQDIYHGYIDMRRSVAENLDLNRKVAQLTNENLMLRRSHEDLARMRALLWYSQQSTMPTMLGQVVMLDKSGRFKSMIVDRGSDDGVEINDVVVNPDGLIGRVVLTTRDLSKVQLITDANSSVGTLIERTRRQGIIRGNSRGELQLYNIPNLSDVVPGDTLSTAGIDGIYPKGIPVARARKAEEGKGLFKTIYCASTVDFTRIEDVLIIRTKKIPPEVVRYEP
jgi:rod shape-determining protein MreC